jgi:hypothetical protein
MNLLAAFRKPKPDRAPGRHSTQWAPHRITELEVERDDLRAQLACRPELTQVYCMAGRGVHPAWWTDFATGQQCPWCQAESLADDNAELKRWNGRLVEETLLTRELLAGKEKEISILQGILDALEVPVDESGSVPQPALADDPESWINLPFPPAADMRIVDIAPGPVGSEAADVCARTQSVDMRALRAEMDEAEAQPRPVLPGELARSEAMTVSTPVMTLTERGTLVQFTKPQRSLIRVAPVAAERAHESVEAAVGAAS